MPSLPTVGQAVWGQQLNDYLSVEHNNDGTQKTGTSIKGFVNVNDHGATQGGTDATTAVNAAQDALVAAGGGILYFPPGLTYVSATIHRKQSCHWQGAGSGVSSIYWSSDLGAGLFGCLDDNSSNAVNTGWQSISLIGPGTTPGVGVKPCNMSGVKIEQRSIMRDVRIANWNIGVSINADHNLFDRVMVTNCYWGVSWPESGWNSKGDQSFISCDFTGCNLAGWHCAGSNTIDHALALKCHFGFGPFGILREDYANGTAADAGFLLNCAFRDSAFEYIGNECVADLSTSGNSSWLNCTIENAGYTDNAAYLTTINDVHGTPYSRKYIINLGGPCVGGYIKDNSYPFTAGSLGVYNFGGLSGGSSMPIVYGGYSQPGLLFAFPLQTYIDDLGGEFLSYTPSGTIVAGDLVEIVATAPYGICKRATGAYTTKPVFGVAASGSAGATTVMVQHVGGADGFRVFSETVATPGLALAQITGTYHKVGLAATYPANPVIGFSRGTGGNAGATATVATILNLAK